MTNDRRPRGPGTIAAAGATRGALLLALLLAPGCGGDQRSAPAAGPSPTPTVAPAPAPSGAPGTVAFLPATIVLDNPTANGARSAAASFTVDVVAYDAGGRAIVPSPENPLTIEVHGAPDGAISPATTSITSGSSATFSYDGSFFAVPITLAAWIDHPSGAATQDVARSAATVGRSFGRARLLHGNQPDCSYGSTSYALPLVERDGAPGSVEEALEHGLKVGAAVGHADPSGAFAPFQVDTGSLGVLVPRGDLGKEAKDTGQSGSKFYDSSGRTYAGRYHLAPVSFRLASGEVLTTPPLLVLGVESAYCAPGYPRCHENPPSPDIRYLGVGFDRGGTAADDALDVPADNPFLQVAGAAGANDVSPGYVLTTSGVALGITSTAGFALEQLAPSATVAGDWSTAAGCFAFPGSAATSPFCGTLLVDVGISGMFLALPKDERPASLVDDTTRPPTVPDGATIEVTVGTASDGVLSYTFTVSGEPEGPAPTAVTWVESSKVFVNTGRRPLAAYDYLYDARCGNIGFMALD